MCIGIPMQVITTRPGHALCAGMGEQREVDTWLIDDPEPGDWLLVFIDSAREKLEPARAQQITDALRGLQSVLQGETDIARWFPDLVDREPQLPEFLRPPSKEAS